MRIQLISDLHLECYKKLPSIIPKSNYLALCGDIGYPFENHYNEYISLVSKIYEKVFVVSGNHEYYNYKHTMEEIDDQIEKVIKQYNNVYYLNNDEHIVDDIVILGTTLWSDVSKEEVYIKQMMNDYNKIYFNNPHKTFITPKHVTQLFHNNVSWLGHKILEHRHKKIVILSHHLPSFQLISEKYKDSKTNCAYASNLEYLLHDHVVAWLCGHTHIANEVKINQCLCVVNPRGYPNENLQYDEKVINIE